MYPILFDIADLEIRSYDFFAALAVLAGFIVLFFNLRKTPEKQRKTAYIFTLLLFIPFLAGALLGRLAESLVTSSAHASPGEASLWAGFAAAAAASLYIARLLKRGVWETGDLLAPSIAIAGFFLRIGCFLNGCCFGSACPEAYSFPAFYPAASPASALFENHAVYPVQLFEALAWLLIFMALLLLNIRPGFKGRQILLLFILYAVARFFIDFYRYYPDPAVMNISSFWAVLAFLIAVFAYFIRQKQK